MCTIVAIKGRHLEFPLLVAANRDEFYTRPTEGPRRVHEDPRAVAGLDGFKGGTWMGANARGIFVALTNQRQYRGADPTRSSRGAIVLAALAEREVEGVDALLESIDARDYNGFNLLYGDATTLRVAYARPERAAIETQTLEDGIWVLPNDRIGSPEFPKARRARALAEPLVSGGWPELALDARRLLRDHEVPPLADVPEPPAGSLFTHAMARTLQSICVHTPVYGTRSSTLLALSPRRVEHYLYADGPPCQSDFRDVTELLR